MTSIPGKIGVAVLCIAWILMLCALLVDELTVLADDGATIGTSTNSNSTGNSVQFFDYFNWGATEFRVSIEFDHGSQELTQYYSFLCERTDRKEACELQTRGDVWIVFNCFSLIAGCFCVLAAIHYEFEAFPDAIGFVFKKKMVAVLSCSIACATAAISTMVWWINNPIFNIDSSMSWYCQFYHSLEGKSGVSNLFGSNFEETWQGGPSMWLALCGSFIYLVCIVLFVKVFHVSSGRSSEPAPVVVEAVSVPSPGQQELNPLNPFM